MKAMKAELKASGLTEEEILQKTTVLMKAFNKTDPTADIAQYALASKQKNSALKKNNTSPKDFTLVIISIYRLDFAIHSISVAVLARILLNFKVYKCNKKCANWRR